MLALVVTRAFADYPVGAQIADPAQIAATLESSNAANVVPIDVADVPQTDAPAAG
jgi:hypothetical protein